MSRNNIFSYRKIPGVFFDALKTGKNKKSCIFQESGIPEIHVQLFENFQNLIGLQVCCLTFTKNIEWLANETVLGQSSPNKSGGKICQNL